MASELIIQYEHRVHECSRRDLPEVLHNYSVLDWRLVSSFAMTNPLSGEWVTLIFEKPVARNLPSKKTRKP